MTNVFIATRSADLIGTSQVDSTLAGSFDADFSTNSIRIPGLYRSEFPFSFELDSVPVGDFFMGMRWVAPNTSWLNEAFIDGDWFHVYDASGSEIAWVDVTAGGYMRLCVIGDTTVYSDTSIFSNGSVNLLSFRIEVGADIVFSWYLGVTLLASVSSPNTGGKTQAKSVVFTNNKMGRFQNYQYISELIVMDGVSTVGMHVTTLEVDGDGVTTDWNGAFASVANPSIDTYIDTTVIGDYNLFSMDDYTGPGGLSVISIIQAAYVKAGALGGPTNASLAVNIGGINYDSPTFVADTIAPSRIKHARTVDPSTGVAWTISGINAMQSGIKSS